MYRSFLRVDFFDLLNVRNRQLLVREDISSSIYPLCESCRVKLIPAIRTAVMV